MKGLRVILALVIATVCIVSLATCTKLIYYLEQVCKVYGTVTVAGTDPPTPIGSVEVVVGDYQYSELTNYYGDYEMEMAEGIWTINFRKEGYEPVTEEVTFDPENENQRVRLDVSMVWIQPPTTIDLTGYWDWFFTPDCDPDDPDCEPAELGPVMLGIQQTNSTLVADLEDFEGSINGSAFSLTSADLGIDLTGIVSGSGEQIEISGIFTGEILGGNGTFRIVPTAATFGTLKAEGIVNEVDISIDTDFALGSGGEETEIRYVYNFPLTADWFSGHVWLQTANELSTGFYRVNEDEAREDDDISVRLYPSGGGELFAVENESLEQVNITNYDSNGIAGTFDLELDDGRMLDFTIPDSAPIAVVEDLWYTVHFEVDGWDPMWSPDERNLFLWLHVDVGDEPGHVLIPRLYDLSLGDNWWFSPEWESPSGNLEDFHPTDPSGAGTLDITRFDRDGIGNDDGVAGFLSAAGSWGWLEAEFDVYFYDEWEPEDY